jgi:SPP1 gp7 family putative phage head morphogenesis protein
MPQTFRPPNALELAYRDAINNLMHLIMPQPPLFVPWEQWVGSLADRGVQRGVVERATGIAAAMVKWNNIHNAQTWRQAAARSQHGRLIHRLLQREMVNGPVGRRVHELTDLNARLIVSLPQDVAKHLTNEMGEAQRSGTRAGTVAKLLQTRYPELLASRVNLLARTGTAQAATALTRARSEEMDLPAYVWLSSKDQRVRKSHRKMNDVICLWADPPNPELLVGESTHGSYNSGDDYNCRCTQRVLLSLDDVKWPHRVATGGDLRYMTRVQFARLTGLQRRMAA